MTNEEDEAAGVEVSGRLLGLLILGATLVFLGITVLVIASVVLGGSGSVGGIILIGPVPIVFGAGTDYTLLIFISVIMAFLSLAYFLVMSRRKRKE